MPFAVARAATTCSNTLRFVFNVHERVCVCVHTVHGSAHSTWGRIIVIAIVLCGHSEKFRRKLAFVRTRRDVPVCLFKGQFRTFVSQMRNTWAQRTRTVSIGVAPLFAIRKHTHSIRNSPNLIHAQAHSRACICVASARAPRHSSMVRLSNRIRLHSTNIAAERARSPHERTTHISNISYYYPTECVNKLCVFVCRISRARTHTHMPRPQKMAIAFSSYTHSSLISRKTTTTTLSHLVMDILPRSMHRERARRASGISYS